MTHYQYIETDRMLKIYDSDLPKTDIILNIEPIINMLLENCTGNYSPGKNICISEKTIRQKH